MADGNNGPSAKEISQALQDALYKNDYAQLNGPVDKVINTLYAMRAIGGGAVNVPGYADELAHALEEDDNILHRYNRAGRVGKSRWYEMLEDGDLISVFGCYLSKPIRFLGSTYHTYKKATDIEMDVLFKGIEDTAKKYANERMASAKAPEGKKELKEFGTSEQKVIPIAGMSPTANAEINFTSEDMERMAGSMVGKGTIHVVPAINAIPDNQKYVATLEATVNELERSIAERHLYHSELKDRDDLMIAKMDNYISKLYGVLDKLVGGNKNEGKAA